MAIHKPCCRFCRAMWGSDGEAEVRAAGRARSRLVDGAGDPGCGAVRRGAIPVNAKRWNGS